MLVLACTGTAIAAAQHSGGRDTGFDIVLSFHTDLPSGLHAILTSTSTYPCTGYVIRAGVTREADTVSISIYGMLRPSPCISLPAEASGTVFLGNPRQTHWILRIRYREEEDLHRLLIGTTQITVAPIRSNFTRVRFR